MAAVQRVEPGAGTAGLFQRAPVAALGCLDQAVSVNIAPSQELGDELQAIDAPLQPRLVATGLDVIPGGDERPSVGVEEIAVVPIADHLARGARLR